MIDDKYIIIITLLIILTILYISNFNFIKSIENFKAPSYITNYTSNYTGNNQDGPLVFDKKNINDNNKKPYINYQNIVVDGKTIPVVRQACVTDCSTTIKKEKDPFQFGVGYPDPNSDKYVRCLDGKLAANNLCKLTFEKFFDYDTWTKEKRTLNLKSYKDFGYNCNIGDGKIPLKYDDKTGVLSCISLDGKNCLSFSNKNECDKRINLVPYNSYTVPVPDPATSTTAPTVILAEPATTAERKLNNTLVINCDKGKIGDVCTNLYNYAGDKYKTIGELGYSSNPNIGDGRLLGKTNTNDTAYDFASYDGRDIIDPSRINYPPTAEIKPIVCSRYSTKLEPKYGDVCYQAFKEFSLFPSSSPLIIRGNNLKQAIPNTITDVTKLREIYINYPNVFNKINTDYGNPDNISQGIADALRDHPTMLYCCNTELKNRNVNKTVRERVPLDPTIDYSKHVTDMSKYDFDYKSLSIDPSVCPIGIEPGSTVCDNFMGMHCENIFNEMKSKKLDIYKQLENYAPECACYAPKKNTEAQFNNVPSICYKNGCTTGSSAYIDPGSRNKNCDITICTNIINSTGISSGGNYEVSGNLQNNCGKEIQAAKEMSKSNTKSDTKTTSTTDSTDFSFINSIFETTNPETDSDSNTDNSTNSNTNKSIDSNTIVVIVLIIVFILILFAALSSILR